MNTLAIGGPCKLCGRPNIEHGNGQCPPAVQWAADGAAYAAASERASPDWHAGFRAGLAAGRACAAAAQSAASPLGASVTCPWCEQPFVMLPA